MRNIIFATDLSKRADIAFDRAVQLAEEHKAQLHIIHVIDNELPANLVNVMTSSAKAFIEKQIESTKLNTKTITINIASGDSCPTIIKYADKIKADIIIIGTHRRKKIQDFILGSVIERILRFSHVPVLVVRKNAAEAYTNIVVAVDFSELSRKALRVAVENFPKAKINAAHSYGGSFEGLIKSDDIAGYSLRTHEEELTKVIQSIKSKVKIIPHLLSSATYCSDTLVQFTQSTKTELLILGAHGRPRIVAGFIGSTAINVLKGTSCDMLFVK
jgi:nucleotide-binding universal stress UspA family protein